MKINLPFFKNSLIFLHIIFAAIGFYTFFLNYQLSENILIQKASNKQLILAKSGSISVENLLRNVQNQLESFIFSFTKVSDTETIDEKTTRDKFAAYMQRAQLPINGIALYNEQGKLVILENRQSIHSGENDDFSQTAFIQWAKNSINKNKTFVSTPYIGTTGASIGKVILVVAKPIYFGQTYKGTLAIRLLVGDFSKAFINPLSSDASEDSFVLTNTGVFVSGSSSLLNQNLYTYARSKKWSNYQDFIVKLQNALKTDTTQTTWTFKNPKDTTKSFIVGVSKIDIPDTDKDLYFVVMSSKNDVLIALKPLRTYGFVWMGFGLLTTVIGGLIVLTLRD